MTSMKQLLTGLIILIAGAPLIRSQVHASAGLAEAQRTPVIIDLFTSEGCSSCPPADTLLARLANEQPVANVQLIALEEHVDYWNDGGWTDPFSSRDWTERQYVYAGALKNRNPYTPQMIVDGTVEFVGNHPPKAREAILKAASSAKIPVMLAPGIPKGSGKESLSVKIGKLEGTTKGDSAEVWLALTETGLHSALTRGENAGGDLHHAAVVRSMRKIGQAKADGEPSFTGDANVSLQKE